MNINKKSSNTILERAIGVMDLIASHSRPYSFNEVLASVGFNRATLAKILRILYEQDLLEKSVEGYTIGQRVHVYAAACPRRVDLILRCRPIMELLSEQFGITVVLVRVIDDQSVCLDKIMHENSPAMRPIGSVTPESPIHPWTLLTKLSEKDYDPKKMAKQIKSAALKVKYVKKQPAQKDIEKLILASNNGVGDDLGLFIPNTRRLAVEIMGEQDAELRTFIMVGLFASVDDDLSGLIGELKNVSCRLNEKY